LEHAEKSHRAAPPDDAYPSTPLSEILDDASSF